MISRYPGGIRNLIWEFDIPSGLVKLTHSNVKCLTKSRLHPSILSINRESRSLILSQYELSVLKVYGPFSFNLDKEIRCIGNVSSCSRFESEKEFLGKVQYTYIPATDLWIQRKDEKKLLNI